MLSFTEKLIHRASALFVKYPLIILFIACLATSVLYPNTVALFKNVKTDFASLLPKDYPSVKRVEEMGTRFGSIKNLIVVFETGHKEVIEKMFADFAGQVEKIPGVSKVRYKKPGYDFFMDHKLLYLSQEDLSKIKDRIHNEIQKAKLGALYMDFEDTPDFDLVGSLKKGSNLQMGNNLASPFFTNKDENTFLFEVYPAADVGTNVQASKDFYHKISQFITEFKPERYAPDVQVSYSGSVKNVVDEYKTIIRDLQISGLISWVLILIFLYQYFRSVSLTIVTFIPLIIGMIWGFGLCYTIVGQLNMITAFLFSVLAGLGIENGIHLTTRYFEERREGKSPQESCFIMLSSTGRPAFMAAATTVGTMAVMLISKFRGFSEFGGIMAVGVVFIFSSYVVLLGPLLILLERWRIIKNLESTATHVIDPFFFMNRWTQMRYVKPILVSAFLLCCFSIWSIFFKVHFDYNFAKLNQQTHEVVSIKSKTDTIYQANTFPAVMWVDDADEASQVKAGITQYMKVDSTPTIQSVLTLGDLVPKNQSEKISVIRDIQKMLKDPLIDKINNADNNKLKPDEKKFLEEMKKKNAVVAITLDQIPDEVTKMFYGVNRKGDEQFVYVIPKTTLDLEDGRDSIAFANDIRDIQVSAHTYHAVSHTLIFADLLIMLMHDMKLVIILAVCTAFFLLWLDFRKIGTALLVMFPLLVGILWSFGFMWMFNLKLNLFNIVVFPCLLGMSIDNATHIFYRIKETGIENMIQVLRMTGNSIVMSVLTAISGFAGLILAHHRGLYSTGVLAEIGLVTTLVSALICFPALLQWLSTKGIRFDDKK